MLLKNNHNTKAKLNPRNHIFFSKISESVFQNNLGGQCLNGERTYKKISSSTVIKSLLFLVLQVYWQPQKWNNQMAQMGCCEEKKYQFHCSHCSRKTMCRVIFVMRSFVLPLLHCGLYNNLFFRQGPLFCNSTWWK